MKFLSDDSGLSRAVSPDTSECEERIEEVETVVREPLVICVQKNVSQCHYSLITHYQPAPTQGSRCHHCHLEKSLSSNYLHFTFRERKCSPSCIISWQCWWWRCVMRATARNAGSVSVLFLRTRPSLTATDRSGKSVAARDQELAWRPWRLTAPPDMMRSINI